MRRVAACAMALAAASAVAVPCGAITPDECAVAFEQAQVERAAGKHLSAREKAMTCSQLECAQAIRQECVRLHDRIQSELPTWVISAQTPAGKELVDVRVALDGKPLLTQLDGRPIELDPGVHTLHLESADAPPVEMTITARVGEQNRQIQVTLGHAPPVPEAPPATAPVSVSTSPVSIRRRPAPVPVASYVLAGGGLVALGVFGYLQYQGRSDYDELVESRCKPACDPGKVSDIRSKIRLSYVPLGIGVAALSGAVVLFALRGEETESSAVLRLRASASAAGADVKLEF